MSGSSLPARMESEPRNVRVYPATAMRTNGESQAVSNSAISTQIGLLQQSLQGLVTAFGEFKSQTRTELQEIRTFYAGLAEKFQEKQKTNWPLLISMFTAVCILVGAAWKISDLQTKNTTSPLETTIKLVAVNTEANARLSEKMVEVAAKIRGDIDANTARDEVSQEDRKKLNERAEKAETHLAKLETDNQVITAKLAEIETQFRASDGTRNMQFATQERMNNIIMQLTKSGVVYPLNPYFFPAIAPAATPK